MAQGRRGLEEEAVSRQACYLATAGGFASLSWNATHQLFASDARKYTSIFLTFRHGRVVGWWVGFVGQH